MEQFRNVNSLREEDRASLEEFNHSPYPRTYHYQSPSLKEAMMKWEYKIVGDFGNYTEMLNGYGVEGWELVSVLPNQGHETGFYVFIFKRPIQKWTFPVETGQPIPLMDTANENHSD